MSAVPPIATESRPADITARVHRMRVARGACWVIVAVLAAGAGLALLDALTPLPAWFRGLALAAWLTGFGVLVWWLVARRLPADPSTSPRHARTELGGNLRAAAAAALALAASLSAATLVPGAGEHIRRVTLPWTRTVGPVLYRVQVTAGDPVVRRGDSVTLSAYAEKIDPAAATPATAILVWRNRGGVESSMPMSGDGTGAFHATQPNVTRGFEYRVDVGDSSSDWHTVTVLDPVEPTAQSRIEIAPPPYAPGRGTTVVTPFGAIEGHQYASASIHLHFSQPAGAAFLEWRGDDGGPAELVPIVFDSERTSGTASFRLTRNGTLKLVTVAEAMGKSLRSEFPARVRVAPDTPPRFEQVVGLSPRPRTARPDARIGIAFTAIDDLAVGSAVLEYAVGDEHAKVVTLPLDFSGSSPRHVQGRMDVDLGGKARVGETIRLRIRINDTRRLDQPSLAPQSASYPESGWSILAIDPTAPPIVEQDIIAQRSALGDPLGSTLEALKSAQTEIARVRQDTAGKTDLPLDQTVRLANIRDGLRRVADTMRTAAREAALTAELRGLSGRVAETADQRLGSAEESLKRAATNSPTDRAAALASAIDSLRAAMTALDRLLLANQRIARARLDRKAIAALVTDQAAVADLAQPGGTIEAEELARLEREVHARLRKLIADSDNLRAAAEAAKVGEVRRLVLALRELAGFVRDLDTAARHLEAEARKSLLAKAERQQVRIVNEAAQLLSGSESAARLAGCELLSVKEFARVTKLIETGKIVEALTELETRAQGLETAALAMEKWTAEHRDPRIAARQLGVWQEDVHNRFRAATKNNPANFARLADAEKATFREEQLALLHFAQSLRIPPGVDLRSLHKELILQASTSAAFENPARAEKSMSSAIELFNRLAEAIPTIPDRLAKTRADFTPILAAQEAIVLELEQAIRAGDAATKKKLPGLVERQQKQETAFSSLDLPGLEPRVIVITAALAAVESDLRAGTGADALASQHWLKREFDRLRLVLDGSAAPDDRAQDVARKLAALARTVQDLAPSFTEKQLQAYGAEALALAREIASIGIPTEAPALGNDARVAALQLEAAARDAVQKPEEFQNRLRPAADAMNRLAARLTSTEADFDRVRRLAANRWAGWENARKMQGKPPSPDGSAETRRQLVREAEELTHTRVGLAGQAFKKAVIDQYLRLKDHDAPDRQGGPLKALSQSLDELAALMADIEDLCTPIDRALPRPPFAGPDRFIPRPELAASFRDLAGQHRELRRYVARVNDEALFITRPGNANRVANLVKDQRELAGAITALARQIERDNDDAKLVLDAAIHATLAADGLAVGMLGPGNGSAQRAGEQLLKAAAQGKHWAKAAADLAARQDAHRASMLDGVPPGELAAQQKARGEELAERAAALAEQLKLASQSLGMPELVAASKECAAVATLIGESTRQGANRKQVEASRLRAEAAGRLAVGAEKMMAAAPPGAAMPDLDPATVKTADALRRADTAMRQALELLEPNTDRSAAEKAMRRAADALGAAAGACAELFAGSG